MTENPPTPPETVRTPTGAPSPPFCKRLIGDREIIQRRAEGQTLKVIAADAGVGVPALSEWFKRPNIATKLADAKLDIKLTKELADRERREKERKAKAAKRKATRDAKAAEPEVIVWDKEGGERYDAYVERAAANNQHGRVGRAIHWS